jgi:hypothetical protein
VESSSHRRVSGWIAWALALALTAPVAALAAAAVPQNGTFALLGGTAQIVSKLKATPYGSGIHVSVQQFPIGSSAPIMHYDVDMQRTIHMVVVRDDFATFEHLHPSYNTGTGAFLQQIETAAGHRYYVYADTQPHGLNQQVFRFNIGSSAIPTMGVMHPNFAPSAPAVEAGPYEVGLSATTFPAQAEQTLHLSVKKGGHLANDLGLYLGAPAHCVFINTQTLQYVHVHAVVHQGNGMAMAVAGPEMTLDVPALPAGTYKLWVEFRGANYGLYTAAFTLAAQ